MMLVKDFFTTEYQLIDTAFDNVLLLNTILSNHGLRRMRRDLSLSELRAYTETAQKIYQNYAESLLAYLSDNLIATTTTVTITHQGSHNVDKTNTDTTTDSGTKSTSYNTTATRTDDLTETLSANNSDVTTDNMTGSKETNTSRDEADSGSKNIANTRHSYPSTATATPTDNTAETTERSASITENETVAQQDDRTIDKTINLSETTKNIGTSTNAKTGSDNVIHNNSKSTNGQDTETGNNRFNETRETTNDYPYETIINNYDNIMLSYKWYAAQIVNSVADLYY